MSKIYTVGFMVHQIDNDYTAELLKGLIPAAKECGINLVLLPGQALNGNYFDEIYAAYEYQHNVVYEYCSKETVDGLIISAGTIGSCLSAPEFKQFVDRFKDIPLLTIEGNVGDYPCIRFDGNGIYSAVEHLIQQHGITRIGFISGPQGNEDADSRLASYRRAMEDNGLEIDETIIGYGNFSEYSEAVVASILDSPNGLPQGICFANDNMCVGAYNVLKSRGLIPGKDILITGYDDSSTATLLDPPLTTVRASAAQMGYLAIHEMYDHLASGKPFDEIHPQAHLITRGSCGCSSEHNLDFYSGDDYRQKIMQTVCNLADEPIGDENKFLLSELCELTCDIVSLCAQYDNESAEALIQCTDALLEKGCLNILHLINMMHLTEGLYRFVHSQNNPALENKMQNFVRTLERHIYSYDHRFNSASNTDDALTTYMINGITKDMTLYANDEKDCFYSVFFKLNLIHVTSSSIFFYDNPIRHTKNAQWHMPAKIALMGMQEGERIEIPKRRSRNVPWTDIFRLSINPDRPRILVANAIFANDCQYGMFICELGLDKYKFIHPIVAQICTAIRMNLLVRDLEISLSAEKTNSALLNEMSMTDELTRIYNRRGFYYYANQALAASKNEGKTAYLIFADLNNLKKINDVYGHEEGDYAIRKVAEILGSVLAKGSIPGRIGGDEFAALTVGCEGLESTDIYNAIKSAAQAENDANDKPYLITASVGIFSFPCSSGVTVQDYLELADNALYLDKQTKSFDIDKHK